LECRLPFLRCTCISRPCQCCYKFAARNHKRFAICLLESFTNCEVITPAHPVIQTTFSSLFEHPELYPKVRVYASGVFRVAWFFQILSPSKRISRRIVESPARSITNGSRFVFPSRLQPARLSYLRILSFRHLWFPSKQVECSEWLRTFWLVIHSTHQAPFCSLSESTTRCGTELEFRLPFLRWRVYFQTLPVSMLNCKFAARISQAVRDMPSAVIYKLRG